MRIPPGGSAVVDKTAWSLQLGPPVAPEDHHLVIERALLAPDFAHSVLQAEEALQEACKAAAVGPEPADQEPDEATEVLRRGEWPALASQLGPCARREEWASCSVGEFVT